jgi:hypothetical protein
MLKSIHKRPKFIQTIIIKKSKYGSFLGVSTFTLEERKRGFLRSRIKKGLSETSKNWGETYPVSSRTLPLVFRLNARYKPLIEVRSRIDVSARIRTSSHFRKCDNKLFGLIINVLK